VGSTITMIVIYPTALPAGTQYWKYGPTAAQPTPHWYTLPATIAGNTATFSITDGGLGDDDLVANGTFVDQGGPGAPGAPGASAAIPTLGEWALIVLAAMLAASGLAVAASRMD
jgi:trimeric autotransporter adhesin